MFKIKLSPPVSTTTILVAAAAAIIINLFFYGALLFGAVWVVVEALQFTGVLL